MNRYEDPLGVLRVDETPVDPDPAFAAGLRARLQSALSLPANTEGVLMSDTDTAVAELRQVSADRPEGRGVIPYLAVSDARAALGWYSDALGATVIGEPVLMDDGRIGHAELELSGSTVYLADEYPELGLQAPAARAVSVSLMLQVADTDAALRAARENGATVERDSYEAHGSRNATVIDPFGHRWMLAGPVTGEPTPIRHGDIGYVSVWTRDADRAVAFYRRVLGWTFDDDDDDAADGSRTSRQVTNTSLPVGVYAGDGPQTLFCSYAVDDLAGARDAIIAGGGTVGETTEHDFATTLDATDPLGRPFAVFAAKGPTPRPALNGTGPGDLSYVTHYVTDSSRFRAFYAGVLHWTFEPGRVDDGWEVQNSQPMAGMAGGAQESVTVPMWTVADIAAAIERVTEAGGTVVQQPERQSYGLMAECTDDQGARFYLGEF